MSEQTYETLADLEGLSPEEVATLLRQGKLDAIFGASGENRSGSYRQLRPARGAEAQAKLKADRARALSALNEAATGE